VTARDSDVARFKLKVASPGRGCWLWSGATNRDTGYGRFKYEGAVWYAHRWAWEHMVSPIPAGYFIDHLCRVRSCVNPRHLEAVTPSENARRRPPRPSPVDTPSTHARSRPSRSRLDVSPSP
jgi:hypothetical protein